MRGFKQGLEEDVSKRSVRGWGGVVGWVHPKFFTPSKPVKNEWGKNASRAKLKSAEADLKCG